MEIKQAEFVASYPRWQDGPKSALPEYAFIGRSNVGKSTLINYLCDNKKLAKTSGTPGKTQLINYFFINQGWYLVDLPGYGYARVSKSLRAKFEKLIKGYLLNREQLTTLFVLIDGRIPPQQKDLDFIEELGVSGIPFSIVFTKVDKLTDNEAKFNRKAFKDKLLESWDELPPIFITSSAKKRGKEEILNYIGEINTEL